jgi:hypothetical protein
MMRLRIVAATLALLLAPMAVHASDITAPNPKLREAGIVAPLVPKSAAPEARMSYACALGQAGGVALGFMLGSGRAWDALTDAVLGHPPSADQRAYCALAEALAPHVAAAAEGVTQEAIALSGAQIEQAWAALRDRTAETSAALSADVARLCEGSANCVWLRDAASGWARLWPFR